MTPCLKRARAISEHVAEVVKLTSQFATDTGLKDNVVKSRRFGTTAEIRTLLGASSGPKVADWIKDLGVIQVAGACVRSAERMPRQNQAIERLSRPGRMALPFKKK
eukprot:4264349-Heterocapsa_arctica.AAC.1